MTAEYEAKLRNPPGEQNEELIEILTRIEEAQDAVGMTYDKDHAYVVVHDEEVDDVRPVNSLDEVIGALQSDENPVTASFSYIPHEEGAAAELHIHYDTKQEAYEVVLTGDEELRHTVEEATGYTFSPADVGSAVSSLIDRAKHAISDSSDDEA